MQKSKQNIESKQMTQELVFSYFETLMINNCHPGNRGLSRKASND
uniref:Uncharacterized protein n=1 Tax=Arundo donax TaxID=35708 RepID=A0A0A9E903_ARUDO